MRSRRRNVAQSVLPSVRLARNRLRRVRGLLGSQGRGRWERLRFESARLRPGVRCDFRSPRNLSRRSRNQKGVRRLSNNQPRLSRAVLDDPPIHIRPNCSRQSGCKGKNPLDSSHDGPTILPKNISAATPICAKNITESVRKGLKNPKERQRAQRSGHSALTRGFNSAAVY